MNAVDALLMAFDHVLEHKWESLGEAQAGLTAVEAAWQPEAYAGEPRQVGVAWPGTVAWHLHHLAECHRDYVAALDRSPTRPACAPSGDLSLAAVQTELGRANATLRSRIAELTPEQLDETCRHDERVGSFVSMVTRHVAWHAAQIKQTRRLYRSAMAAGAATANSSTSS